jgi:hypothetical protein
MKKIIYLSLISGFFLTSCEKTINPPLEKPEEIMVVDAWINQKIERQEIRITKSQSYFDNSVPVKIANATVTVEDLTSGMKYNFKEGAKSYYWDPVGKTPFGAVGHHFKLTIVTKSETFEAFSHQGRVPPIDSIKFKYNKEDLLVKQDYYTAEFVATDPVGLGDHYWIKAFKNGAYLNKPAELNMAADAGFTSGQSVDGQVFIIPVRKDFINPLDEIKSKKGTFSPPYLVGDSVHVEIHSIDPLAFEFLFGLYFQINRPGGFAELFAMPPSNSKTNIVSANKKSTTNVAGFFNVASVSSGGKKLTKEIADKAKLIGD